MPSGSATALTVAEAQVVDGKALEAIETLRRANARAADPAVECRLAELRYVAFGDLVPASKFDRWPVPVPDLDRSGPPRVPEVPSCEVSAEAIRRAISTHGSVRIPGLLSTGQVKALVDGIDHVLDVRAANTHAPYRRHSSWFSALPLSGQEAQSLGRPWIAAAGGMLACDSPKLLELIFSTYDAVGLRDVVTDYLGERPVLSANKCTLRRVPLTANADWHQDGAFLGDGIRALNIWIALSDCGVDAPGMDLVPRRFEAVQETGTGGAIFDWAVGPEVVAELAADAPVVRPVFRAGDALLFDDLFLHRTAIEPTMTRERYAIESWFFAPSSYPSGQVPLVW